MSITREDVVKCYQVAYKVMIESDDVKHTLAIETAPPMMSHDQRVKYEQAMKNYENLSSIYFGWCDVLTKIDSGVDPTIAVLGR
jgi:hypothetical protein